MNKFKIDSTKYDFLWKVNNFPHFFVSFWIHDNYRKRDMIFANDESNNGSWEVYMGVKEREKTSEDGYRLISIESKFSSYEKSSRKLIKKVKKYFKILDQDDYSKLPDNQLSTKLKDACKFCEKLWERYSFTEHFYYDKIEKILLNNSADREKISMMKKNIKKMQKIKYDLRFQVNRIVMGKHVFLKIMKEVSARLKIELENLYWLDYREIVELLRGKKIVRKYKKIYVVGKFSNWQLIYGKEARRIINLLRTSTRKHSGKIIYGKVGNRGYYKGKVKIIPFDIKADMMKEIDKMKKGDVLVTSTTGPEMILACKKAGAIITEVGGIASHADIVSRELKIPAVIATKAATEVLKDGDVVEVDADKGIVRIINKKYD